MEDARLIAEKAAKHVYTEMFSEHRGVIKWHAFVAVFGNDGYRQSEKTRVQVEVLRQLLDEAGLREIGFGLHGEETDEGYSWALLTESEDISSLHNLVWRAHQISIGARPNDPLYRFFKKTQGGNIAKE